MMMMIKAAPTYIPAIKGTIFSATFPIRLIPPIITIATKIATTTPKAVLAHPESIPKVPKN